MKAILLRRPGGPEALEYVEVPTPVPGEGQVLVKADTIGVSMPEVLVRRGTYAWMPPLPAIPGIELSGTVVAHGPNTAEPTPQIEHTVADDGAVRVAPRRRKADELH
jgi:NADPH2:quinone reductase